MAFSHVSNRVQRYEFTEKKRVSRRLKARGANTEVKNSAPNSKHSVVSWHILRQIRAKGVKVGTPNSIFRWRPGPVRPPLNESTAVTPAERRDEDLWVARSRLENDWDYVKKRRRKKLRRIAYRTDGRRALSQSQLRLCTKVPCALHLLLRMNLLRVRVRGDRAHSDGNSGSNCCSRRREDMGYDRSTNTRWTARRSDFEKRVGHPFIPARSIVLFGIPFFFFVFFSLRCLVYAPLISREMARCQRPVSKVSWNGAPPKGKIRSALACNIFFALCEKTGSFMVKSSETCFSPAIDNTVPKVDCNGNKLMHF